MSQENPFISKNPNETTDVNKCVRLLASPVHNRRVFLAIGVISLLLVMLQLNLAHGFSRDQKLSKIHHLVARDLKNVHKNLPRDLFDVANNSELHVPPEHVESKLTEDKVIMDLLSAMHPLETDVRKAFLPRKGFDITPPLPFNPSWKNPCWTGQGGSFHCIPYYYIIGFPRCGVRDLHVRIGSHPLITTALTTRPNWWTRDRANVPIGNQSRAFGAAVRAMGAKHRKQILGHADSSAILQVGDLVIKGPKRSERIRKRPAAPRLMTPYIMHAFNNETKFIVLLRNPTDGLYSDYLSHHMLKGKDAKSQKSARLFHYHALQAIAMYEDCFMKQNVRACVYDSLLSAEAEQVEVPIAEWLYPVYLGDWLQVFPRDQFYFTTTEQYSSNTVTVLQDIYSFLGVGSVNEQKIGAIAKEPRVNSNSKIKSQMEPMLPRTREKLDAFFAPFKKTLVNMLDDERFYWSDSTSK